MTSDALSRMLGMGGASTGTARPPTPLPRDGVVTKLDDAGVWVTPLDGDARTPLGPCRGARRDVLVPVGDGYELRPTPLPVGTRVLVISTTGGIWIVRADT